MRLPWPFGRRTSPDGPSSTDGEDGGTGASTSGPGTAAGPGSAASPGSPAPPTGAWASLPPIQRTVGSPPLVAPAAPFLEDVPGHRPLPPIVQPLGHEVGPSAPPGLVVAHARPVPSLTSGSPLPTRPVQRHAAHGSATAPAPTDALAAEHPAAASAATPSPDADAAPVRRLATIAPAATVTPAAQPLTRAPAAPTPLVSRSSARPGADVAALAGSVPPARATTPPAASSTSAPGRPAHATTSRWAESASSPGASPAAAWTGAPLHPAGPATRRGAQERQDSPAPTTSGEPPAMPVRRAGLGAPIPVPPASAVAQRLPDHASRPPMGPVSDAASPPPDAHGIERHGPDVPVPAAARADAEPGHAAGPAPATTPAPSGRLQVLPVARRRTDEPATPGTAAPSTPAVRASGAPGGSPARLSGAATSAVRTATSAARPAEAVRPTMGARPIRPHVTAQREPAGEDAHGVATQAVASATVAARWDASGELPDTVTALPGRHATPVVPVQLSPLAADPASHGGRTGQAAQAGPAGPAGGVDLPGGRREITFPARDVGAMTAARIAVAGSPSYPGARGGAPSPAPASAQEPPLTLARSVVAAPPPAPAVAPAPVNRIVAEAPAAAPSVQGPHPAGGAPVISATPIVQRVDGAAPPAESGDRGGQAHSETELDELAKALFGRIRTHLRTEVIHEREAKGLTFDAF